MKMWWQKFFGKTVADTSRSNIPAPQTVPVADHYRDETVGNDASARPWEFNQEEALALAAKTAQLRAAYKQPQTMAFTTEFRPDVPLQADSGLLRSRTLPVQSTNSATSKTDFEQHA